MHSKRILGAYSYNIVAENEASAVRFDFYVYDLLVFDSVFFSVFRCCVNVTLCYDNAFF